VIQINDGEESMYEFKVYRLKSGEVLAIGKPQMSAMNSCQNF